MRSTSPRTVRASARCSIASATRRRHTPPPAPAGGARARRPRRLPAARAPLLRARRARHGDRLRPRRPRRLPAPRGQARGGTTTPPTRARRALHLFLDRFLEDATEVDVDALCDGDDVWIGGIMQHVEEAGVHSGDSACVLPPHSLGEEMLEQIREPPPADRPGARRRRAAQRAVRCRTPVSCT
jgi:hypothetical protein